MRACFLDRDGVINKAYVRNGKPYPPATLEEFEILPCVSEALALLKEAGFLLVVVTNQPDIARGVQRRDVMEAMHGQMCEKLPIDDLYACCEEDGPLCLCYKPKPGMLLEAARKHQIDLGSSYMIGDRWRDVGAGKSAGCKTVFIERHYAEELKERPDFICADLLEGAKWILQESGDEN